MPTKLVNLKINEMSGVDFPANLEDGWVIMKSADNGTVDSTNIAETAEQLVIMKDALSHMLEATGTSLLASDDPEVTKSVETVRAYLASLGTPTPKEPKLSVTETVITPDASEAIAKAVEAVRAEFEEKLAKANTEATEALAKAETERVAREDAAEIAKARELTNLTVEADTFGPMIRKMREMDPAVAEEVERVLKSANEALAESALLTEKGKTGQTVDTSAYGRLQALAVEAVEKGRAKTEAEARILIAEENPALYAEYKNEVK